MDITQFIGQFNNYPVLFVGTGLSLRYLENSYSWDDLLKKVCVDFTNNDEFYYDIKAKYNDENGYQFDKIASEIEKEFEEALKADRNGKFKFINDIYYKNMQQGVCISRFKLYISHLFDKLKYRENDELEELQKAGKNISSIITTNYDCMLENLFEFEPLIGNDILLSNPYGSIYKIHGSVEAPDKIIITAEDYSKFCERYELIRAQLLSLFIHHPIIFVGYGVGDRNIKDILKTIFTYVDYNSEMADKVRANFLLVEYEKNSSNHEVVEHDIDMEGFSTIRINKIKTDDYRAIYAAISRLQLPVSTMDIRKVQNVVKDIYAGGNISVNINDDIDEMSNHDKVLYIGAKEKKTYINQDASKFINQYFSIIEKEDPQFISLIDTFTIGEQQYFPIYGFFNINKDLKKADALKEQQKRKMESVVAKTNNKYEIEERSVKEIIESGRYAKTYLYDVLARATLEEKISLADIEAFLKGVDADYKKEHSTNYRELLCAYDYVKYAGVKWE